MGTTRRTWQFWVVLVLSAPMMGSIGAAFALAEEESVASSKSEEEIRKQVLALNEITGTNPMRTRLQQMLEDAERTKKLLTVAARMAREKDQPLNRNATFLLALAAENVKDVETSAMFYRLHAKQSLKLQSERGIAQAYVGLIKLYADNKRFEESEKVCKEFLELEGEEDEAVERLKPVVLREMILAIAKQGALERALKMIDNLIKADPRNWLHRSLKAQILREADKLEEAAKLYVDLIERVGKDGRFEREEKEEFIDEYRYILSGVYIDLNDVEKAAEQLKILLAKEPNNPTYNNDLGFIWADRGMNLVEAEKLIRKAIDEERKLKKKRKIPSEEANAAYLDSLGWVLFKQGKAKEALPYLIQAVKQKEGQNIEIYDHLADVHLSLGEKQQAVAAWKKGLEIVGNNKRDQKRKIEVEKKLQMHEEK